MAHSPGPEIELMVDAGVASGALMSNIWAAVNKATAATTDAMAALISLVFRFHLRSLSSVGMTTCPGAAATRPKTLQQSRHHSLPAWFVWPQIVQIIAGPSMTGGAGGGSMPGKLPCRPDLSVAVNGGEGVSGTGIIAAKAPTNSRGVS